ncbi:MAG TPA: bifunctional hydroxymethylpyrimidine kinase/phosphomethylpyrimidine kinase [Terriglobales bacterium]|nr:bifunctional hydroxymethylpyrimidine kinase/phosphomethylpyrimidine kinase [Terriglobales bacterium]
MPGPPVILSIAGYDPSSGAGITADVKTAAALGCYAATCITALTVQSTQGVFGVRPLEPELVARTLNTLADDLEIVAIRIGMLGSGAVAGIVSGFLTSRRLPNVVLDPVIRSSSGTPLLDEIGLEMLRALLPLCHVVTPNVAEAAELAMVEKLESEASWPEALPWLRNTAARLHDLGARNVIITGGHLRPANDYLSSRGPGGSQPEVIAGERIESRSTHGTGCAFATALACRLALGDELAQAARAAKEYVARAIRSAYPLGKGVGPVNHFPE